jgi:hypothetical protein
VNAPFNHLPLFLNIYPPLTFMMFLSLQLLSCTADLSHQSVLLYGVIHNNITSINIHFTPPEQPVRVVVIDFGCSIIWKEEGEDHWIACGVANI